MPLGREFREQFGRPLNPGILRHQITWQRKVLSGQDSFGQDIYTWQDVITVKAQVISLAGREAQYAMQRWAEARYTITQPYIVGMEAVERGSWFVDRAVHYLDVLDIQTPVGSGDIQVLIAKEWAE